MIKVAICDDDKQICSKLIAIVKEYFADIGRPVWVAEFTSGLKLLKANIRFDVIFLDIDMPGLNGIETAKKLRNWDVNSKIVYVTNYSNMQVVLIKYMHLIMLKNQCEKIESLTF